MNLSDSVMHTHELLIALLPEMPTEIRQALEAKNLTDDYDQQISIVSSFHKSGNVFVDKRTDLKFARTPEIRNTIMLTFYDWNRGGLQEYYRTKVTPAQIESAVMATLERLYEHK